MSKFRIQMARRQGELKAKEMGYDCFPVDPFAISEAEDIIVEPKAPDQVGVSGGIIFHNDNVGIFYATNIKSEGFRRFTVAHELGHYFLEGHPEEILKTAPIHISNAGFSQGTNSIELEADHFASGLLMPTRLVGKVIGGNRIGLDGIVALSQLAECSLTASAIRAAECSDYPMAVVVVLAKKSHMHSCPRVSNLWTSYPIYEKGFRCLKRILCSSIVIQKMLNSPVRFVGRQVCPSGFRVGGV